MVPEEGGENEAKGGEGNTRLLLPQSQVINKDPCLLSPINQDLQNILTMTNTKTVLVIRSTCVLHGFHAEPFLVLVQ